MRLLAKYIYSRVLRAFEWSPISTLLIFTYLLNMLFRHLTAVYPTGDGEGFQPIASNWYFLAVTLCWVMMAASSFYMKLNVYTRAAAINFLCLMLLNVIDETLFMPYKFESNDVVFIAVSLFISLAYLGYNIGLSGRPKVKWLDVPHFVVLPFVTYISPLMRGNFIPFELFEAIGVLTFAVYVFVIVSIYIRPITSIVSGVFLVLAYNNLMDELFYSPGKFQLNEMILTVIAIVSGIVLYKYKDEQWMKDFLRVP